MTWSGNKLLELNPMIFLSGVRLGLCHLISATKLPKANLKPTKSWVRIMIRVAQVPANLHPERGCSL
jgi:hypothetical protein